MKKIKVIQYAMMFIALWATNQFYILIISLSIVYI